MSANLESEDPSPIKRYWEGSEITKCQLCDKPITTHFVDGRVAGFSWAIMCMSCYGDFGVGLGTGRGQLYKKQPDGRYLKIEG